jgi:CRP-like cAMP-binding protein
MLVRQGEQADSLHLVESGRLVVRVTTASGENAALNVLGPGDYFGELSLLDGLAPTRSANVIALEPVQTLSLSAASFQALRLSNPATTELLLTLLARRVVELSARVVEAMYETLDQRVHRRLHELVLLYSERGDGVDGGDGADGPVRVPLTQEVLAELAGGTRPSVNLVLHRLAALGIVELGRGRITILDRARLAREAA